MAITLQTHKELSGRGHLVQDHAPPIPVRYYLLLSARPILNPALPGRQAIAWEWDTAQGFLTLCNERDTFELDAHTNCTLVLDDGTCCLPTLTHDYSRPHMKYRVQCPACQLAAPAATAPARCVS